VENLYSPSWYHVALLRPRLSAQVRFHRHVYRGEVWFVIQNPTTNRVHRLTPAAHALVRRMNGEQTADEIWNSVVEDLGDDAPTQDEALQLLGILYVADVLRCDVPPDTEALFRRAEKHQDRERRSRLNPISFRLPLFDPDAFLTRWEPWIGPLFSRKGALLWSAVVAAAVVAALQHAPELKAGARSLFEPESLIALWFSYPIVKVLHELGHAFAVKRWGGEVHETGILFLIFMPLPYVDASAASVFPNKRKRMAVGAAGIAVELFVAAIATFVWIAAEPGWTRHVAYAVMLVGGTSTLLFNGNPLLRFDGYYILADALEIPNLASKSTQYVGALAKRFVLGLRETPTPETSPGEGPWLLGYAISSFLYRIAVLIGIALYLSSRFFIVGVALALLTLFLRLVLPMVRHFAFVLTDPVAGERRGRAVAGSFGLLALLGTLVLALPIPLRTQSEGVIWLPDQAYVRAGVDGFIAEVIAEPYTLVEQGDPLIRARDPQVEAQVRGLEARVRELDLRLHALDPVDRVAGDGARGRLANAQADLYRARERAGEVLMRSPTDGRFVIADGKHLEGRLVRKGETVAYVVDLATATARIVVGQEDAAVLRDANATAWLRLDHDLSTVLPAHVTREVPAATNLLPSSAFGTLGGGPFAVDPMDPAGLRTLERVFQFDLTLPPETEIQAAGERVYVRFDHPPEPIVQRGYRALRRLFLRQLGV
jgi:putative peptide zinc metalloprotease protein